MKKSFNIIVYSLSLMTISACSVSKTAGIPQELVNGVYKCTGGISATDSAKGSIQAAIDKADKAKQSGSVTAEAELKSELSSAITSSNVTESLKEKMLSCIQKL